MEREVSGHIFCSNWIPTKLSEEEIVKALGFRNPKEVTFDEGLLHVHINQRAENPDSIIISPEIESWRLIMGIHLMNINLSKEFTEELSILGNRVFSFGVDIWCGYYFWMYSEKGLFKRYFSYSDGEIEEEGEDIEIDKLIKDEKDENCVFRLSAEFGLNMEIIKKGDLDRKAKIWEFNNGSR